MTKFNNINLTFKIIMIFDFLRRRKEEYEIAKKLFRETFDELVNALYLSSKVHQIYPPPKVKIGRITAFIPEKHEIRVDKEPIEEYLKIKNYIQRLKNYKGAENLQILYEYEGRLKNIHRYLKGVLIHESIHAIRYRLFPERSREERYDPNRRLVEEALANLAKAILLDMDKEEIKILIESYQRSTSFMELFGTIGSSQIEAIEEVYKSLEGLGFEAKKEIENLEKQKRRYKTLVRSSEGYRLGLIAALGLQELPKEQRLDTLINLIKERDTKKLLYELEKIGERGIRILEDEFKKYWENQLKDVKTEDKGKLTELFKKAESEKIYNFLETKKQKSRNQSKDINFILSLFVILAFVSIFYFLFSKEGLFLTVINSIGSNLLNLLFSGILIIFVVMLYTFLKRKNYLVLKNKIKKI